MQRFVLGFTLLASACAAQTHKEVRPMMPFAGLSGPLIIAHRGGALEAPENTLAAIEHGIAVGSDWQEIDVALSSDEVVVVIHDDTVDRTTDGKGAVADTAASTLTKLQAGNPAWADSALERLAAVGVEIERFGDRFADARVPTLDQVLALKNARLMIELKTVAASKVRTLAQKTVDALARAQAWDRVIVGSFAAELLWTVHDLEPSLALIGIAADMAAVEQMLALPVSALAVPLELVPEVKKIAPGRVAIWGWTAYNVEMARAAMAAGAHGIITDAPRELVAVLRREPDLYFDHASNEDQ